MRKDSKSLSQEHLTQEIITLKTQFFAARTLLAGMVKILDRLVEFCTRQGAELDPGLLERYRQVLGEAQNLGFSLHLPGEPQIQTECPNCKAVLRSTRDQPIRRCAWCGFEFR